jgi:hypothetical protein
MCTSLILAKKVEKVVKLQIPAGKANPAPPVGPALGQAGVNIMVSHDVHLLDIVMWSQGSVLPSHS